jgi:cytochrome c biogenesis protein CcdA
VPLSVALVAGALVALNPCSVPLLPAFLSYCSGD